MRGYYGKARSYVAVGATPPDQGVAVPYLIVGGSLALLVAVLRDEYRAGKAR